MTVKQVIKGLVPLALLAAFALPASAGQTGTNPPHNINARLREQNQRIRQGVASGQLTRREAQRLRAQHAQIVYQTDRARITGGRMTPAERRRLEAKLNRTSNHIYRQKHDAQVRP